jgi:hypothetical protein
MDLTLENLHERLLAVEKRDAVWAFHRAVSCYIKESAELNRLIEDAINRVVVDIGKTIETRNKIKEAEELAFAHSKSTAEFFYKKLNEIVEAELRKAVHACFDERIEISVKPPVQTL